MAEYSKILKFRMESVGKRTIKKIADRIYINETVYLLRRIKITIFHIL